MSHLCSGLVYPESCVVFAREGASLKRICMRRRFGRCELVPTYSKNMYDLQYDLLHIPRVMAMNLYYDSTSVISGPLSHRTSARLDRGMSGFGSLTAQVFSLDRLWNQQAAFLRTRGVRSTRQVNRVQ